MYGTILGLVEWQIIQLKGQLMTGSLKIIQAKIDALLFFRMQ